MDNLTDYINAYQNNDYKSLSKNLAATDKRIQFEKWMADYCSANVPKSMQEVKWRTKVIALLCKKTGEDSNSTALNKRQEDQFLSSLISHITPLNKEKGDNLPLAKANQKILEKAAKIFNFPHLYSNLNQVDFPSTNKKVLTRVVKSGCLPTLIFEAIEKKDAAALHSLARKAPEEFNAAMKKQDALGNTPIHLAADNEDLEVLELMFKAAPEGCSEALQIQNDEGNTPINLTVATPKVIYFFSEIAPEAFRKAFTIPDKDGYAPIHNAAAKNIDELVKFFYALDPDAATRLTKEWHSAYSFAKMHREEGFREITKLFKDNLPIKQLHQARIGYKALGLAWHLPGNVSLINKKTGEAVSIEIAGHESPELFRWMQKDLDAFNESYPDVLTKEKKSLLKQLLELGSSPTTYSTKDLLQRIQVGLPVVINSGYSDHAVTVLIWGNQFVVCDRSGDCDTPIQVFHFDPMKMEANDIYDLSGAKYHSEEEYNKLLFTTLVNKLGMFKSELDENLEEAHDLPLQFRDNCTFVSAVTSIDAFFLLGSTRGVNEDGTLGEDPIPASTRAEKKERGRRFDEALSNYQTWLTHHQLSILEKNIQPLQQPDYPYEPDHRIIVEALRKAYLLPLDQLSKKRLERLSEIYLGSLSEKESVGLKCDMFYWQMLGRSPLL